MRLKLEFDSDPPRPAARLKNEVDSLLFMAGAESEESFVSSSFVKGGETEEVASLKGKKGGGSRRRGH